MSAPDPESLSWIGKIAAGFAAVSSPVIYFHRRLEKKADKIEVAASFKEVKDELDLQRGYIAKMFDQVRENEQRAQDRHDDLMKAVYSRMEK